MSVAKATKVKSINSIGRRKEAAARAFVVPGDGNVTVNGKPLDQYFRVESHRLNVLRGFVATDRTGRFDVRLNVVGGGPAGQAGACRLAIARALVKSDESLKPLLRKDGLLTRDPRAVERKKYGRHKARRRPQYSKR